MNNVITLELLNAVQTNELLDKVENKTQNGFFVSYNDEVFYITFDEVWSTFVAIKEHQHIN